MATRIVLSLLVLTAAATAQDGGKPGVPPAVDQRRVDEAIKRGVAYLKTQEAVPATDPYGAHASELVLLTYVHAGLRAGDAPFDALFKAMLDEPMKNTYRVSLQAMILEEVHRVKHQKQLYKCAQFLIDNQCKNGQWGYGEPTNFQDPVADDVASGDSRQGGAREFGLPAADQKPVVVRKITVKRQRDGPETGDNSNSQYAALGLRACHDAGIVLPKEAIHRARKWWRESQHDDESGLKPGVATGPGAVAGPPAGWCYGGKTHGHKAYGSMTAGAVGALAICGYILGEKNPRREIAVLKGLDWLGREFTVAGNPGPSEHIPETGWMSGYYLYALERAGILCGVETIGTHKWYFEGAEQLLKDQKPDGSWLSGKPHPDRSNDLNTVWDTCFAILFLKRATRPLDVASTDKYHPPK